MNLLRSVRLTGLLGFGYLLFASLKTGHAQFPVDDPKEACSIKHLKDAVRVDQYVFRTYQSGDSNADNCLQVIRDGRVIFRRTMDSLEHFTLGQSEDKKWKIPGIKNGIDITGRGNPDMIVSFWDGGKCCEMKYIFELKPTFKLLKTLNASESWPAYFADLDHNHRYYFVAEDWSFPSWGGSAASSMFHSIILEYREDDKGGGFHLALDKMKKPAPTDKQWKADLEDLRNEVSLPETEAQNFIDLWQRIVNLIYEGNSNSAWKLLEEIGPKAQAVKYPDLKSFCAELKTSPY